MAYIDASTPTGTPRAATPTWHTYLAHLGHSATPTRLPRHLPDPQSIITLSSSLRLSLSVTLSSFLSPLSFSFSTRTLLALWLRHHIHSLATTILLDFS